MDEDLQGTSEALITTLTASVVGHSAPASGSSTVVAPPTPIRWFDTSAPGWAVTRNTVDFYVGGEQTYFAMADEIGRAATHNHFVCLAGWAMFPDFPFGALEPDPAMSLRDLLTRQANTGLEVRAMVWHDATGLVGTGDTEAATQMIDGLRDMGGNPRGAAIHDDHPFMSASSFANPIQVAGCHHQKIVVVFNDQGLTGFCGGRDINPDRILPRGRSFSTIKYKKKAQPLDLSAYMHTPHAEYEWVSETKSVPQAGAPMHDVHLRIRGPAAYHLLRTFTTRWTNHPSNPEGSNPKLTKVHALLDRPYPGKPVDKIGSGKQLVQIGHTSKAYPEQRATAARMFTRAIFSARKFIYIEDQYMWHLPAAVYLNAALQKCRSLVVIILIPKDEDTTPFGSSLSYRAAFYDAIVLGLSDHKDRVKIRHLGANLLDATPHGAANNDGTYIHSKTWIFDDEYVISGSANCDDRGWSSDSEVVAGVADTIPGEANFAKRLRMALWRRHLGISAQDDYSDFDVTVKTNKRWDPDGQPARCPFTIVPYVPRRVQADYPDFIADPS